LPENSAIIVSPQDTRTPHNRKTIAAEPDLGPPPRIVIEERALTAGLPGYADYTALVRYRLVPGLW
jgi:hypothetical protein